MYATPRFNMAELVDVPLGQRGGAGDDAVVDWESGNDRAKPTNWPAWKKALNVGCLFLMSTVS